MKTIIAIDPGYEQSAVLQWDGQRIIEKAIRPNSENLEWIRRGFSLDPLATLVIEDMQSFGMPVGKEVLQTCKLIGRFLEAWETRGGKTLAVFRQQIKLHHCGQARAKDANIRQALIDKYGKPGTKKAPGVTYGVVEDLWSAFAIATYATETKLVDLSQSQPFAQ